jgi:pimeloyl-ACP methyl ester carboxylesterase
MNAEIYYRKSGKGPAVVLLHGFPMNHQVWNDFAVELSHNYTVYTPDLPGLGRSPILPGQFTLQDVARTMNVWLEEHGIASPVLIGHSMGGYVALEMARAYPLRFKGLVLFHSTSVEDSAEKKESRTKVVKFIADNGVLAFTSNFIQPLFADPNHSAVSSVKDITVQATAEAVCGYTEAMRDRRDNTEFLSHYARPVLLIGGDKDKGISTESLTLQAKSNAMAELHVLESTGHMGMFEKKEESLKVISAFLFKTV